MENNTFFLMHKDIPLTIISFTEKGEIIDYSRDYNNSDHLPVRSRNDKDWLYSWWDDRKIPTTRNNIKRLLEAKGVSISEEYLFNNLGLSLTDSYWVKPIDSDITWDEINLYTNRFKDNTLIWEGTDSRSLAYSPNSSLNGNVEKTWTANGSKRYLIKGNKLNTSSQSINEVIASHIHKLQKFNNYTEYKLVKIEGKPYDYGCSCELFTDENTELITAYDLILSEPRTTGYFEHLLNVCEHNGMDRNEVRDFLEYQILTDFVMCQTDRHFSNIGFLRDSNTLRFKGMAPIYDSGEAFYANTQAPVSEKDLHGLFTRGFENSAELTLKLVRDPDLIDLRKLPPVSYIRKMYEKDSQENEAHINGICYTYEEKIRMCRNYQLSRF
jgi:hypothetical protein